MTVYEKINSIDIAIDNIIKVSPYKSRGELYTNLDKCDGWIAIAMEKLLTDRIECLKKIFNLEAPENVLLFCRRRK